MARRELLRAGSALGLLSLLGCAERKNAGEAGMVELVQPAAAAVSKPADQSALIDGVLPRYRWTSTQLVHPTIALPMNGVSYITVHHDGREVFVGESELETIERLRAIQSRHVQRSSKNGVSGADIGYHFIIDRAGHAWEGRPLAYQGAHVQDHNEHNVGVACLGNFEEQSPTKAQTDRLDGLLAQLASVYRLKIDAIKTHREWSPVKNPGQNLQAYMARTRAKDGALGRMMAERGLA